MVRPRNVNRTKAPKEIPDWEQEEFESRTDIKKAAQAVTDLGEKLVELTDTKLRSLNLPDDLMEAVKLMKRMDKGPALKRQKAFIGKLLRKNEDLIVEIKEKFQEEELKRQQQNAHFHRLERWRDRLLEEGDNALNELLAAFPQADRSMLRQAMRNAVKEAEQNKPPKSSRAIFQYLKGLEW